ncbi:MAG TPA: DUF4314 domain-containing protein [Candidatus Limadaptatus stercoripullorum]|uniref:DUF4314 domain-containing protein n=1 Tax=Candidatus Limadaptatus stercoripullorum TaxID=2840846 RepID=A0A9D1N9V2_9FIRM|nr:DUF4314 domain-containing protein [Candidatus Limadaptatus stercoripullorum]
MVVPSPVFLHCFPLRHRPLESYKCERVARRGGTITNIDDAGTIHVKWKNGGSLGLIHSLDSYFLLFHFLTPLEVVFVFFGQQAEAHTTILAGNSSTATTPYPSNIMTFALRQSFCF